MNCITCHNVLLQHLDELKAEVKKSLVSMFLVLCPQEQLSVLCGVHSSSYWLFPMFIQSLAQNPYCYTDVLRTSFDTPTLTLHQCCFLQLLGVLVSYNRHPHPGNQNISKAIWMLSPWCCWWFSSCCVLWYPGVYTPCWREWPAQSPTCQFHRQCSQYLTHQSQ